MEKLYDAANLPEAYLLLHLLEQADIPARVLNENAQGAVGEIPFIHAWPQVWLLDPGNRSRADRIVAAFERRESSGPAGLCPACGEENPPGFELCWRCGGPL